MDVIELFVGRAAEIILLGDALPDAGETITIEITDDSNRKITKEITVPGF